MLYLPNIQLNFISFKFIIQISHLLKNKEIINIIKTYHKITIYVNQNKNEIKGIKYRLYNNLLVKQMVGIFKFIAMYIVFLYKLKFLFPKKLSINPNQNSTKAIKRKEKTFWWDIKTHTHNTKTHIKKKPSTLIRVIRKNKNSPKKSRESTHSFMWEKYGLNRKTISNLYKIKWVEEESKYKKEEEV